jgi:hypothetical protein
VAVRPGGGPHPVRPSAGGAGQRQCVAGSTGEFARTRGQLHETFLPTGEFRFVFTLYR